MKEIIRKRIQNTGLFRKIRSLRIYRAAKAAPVLGKFLSYEVFFYVIVGVLTTAVNYLVYFLARLLFTDDPGIVISNVIAWLAAVTFAYLTNKVFVFDSPAWDAKTVLSESLPFFFGRLLSLLFETAFLYLLVTVFRMNEFLTKILAGIIVLTANYFLSKFVVFRRKEPKCKNT